MPSFSCGTALSVVECRNELRGRHCRPLLITPPKCDGCDAKIPIPHCLGCKVGVLVKNCHDESRDSLTCLRSTGFFLSKDRNELLINPCRDTEEFSELVDPSTGITVEVDAKRGDMMTRGFWERKMDCIIDVRTCDFN